MKEGKEKDARYTNGHLFTTITVSGMTMCFACNKSITAKEALICPSECPPGVAGFWVGALDSPSCPQSGCRGSYWELRLGLRARGCCHPLCAAGRGRLPARGLFWGCSMVVWGRWGVLPRAGRTPQTPLPAPRCPRGAGRGCGEATGASPGEKIPLLGIPNTIPLPFGGLRGGSSAPQGASSCWVLQALARGCRGGSAAASSCGSSLRPPLPSSSWRGAPTAAAPIAPKMSAGGVPIAWGGWRSKEGAPPLHELFGCCASISPRPAACNVTIHNRCKDTLPNCTKVKQKVSTHWGGTHRGGGTHGWGTPLTPLLPPPCSNRKRRC